MPFFNFPTLNFLNTSKGFYYNENNNKETTRRRTSRSRKKKFQSRFGHTAEESWATDYFFGNVLRHNGH
jgi:hypothetical protein